MNLVGLQVFFLGSGKVMAGEMECKEREQHMPFRLVIHQEEVITNLTSH